MKEESFKILRKFINNRLGEEIFLNDFFEISNLEEYHTTIFDTLNDLESIGCLQGIDDWLSLKVIRLVPDREEYEFELNSKRF